MILIAVQTAVGTSMIKNSAKYLLIVIFSINLISCSSFEKVEDWMRNTKEYQEEQRRY